MESSQQLVENLKKNLTRNQKLLIAYGNEKLDTILSQCTGKFATADS